MKKSHFTSILAVALILAAYSTLSSGCQYITGTIGNGNVTKQDRTVGSFDALDVSSAFDVYLTQGNSNSLTVEADDNLLPLITTEVVGNTLKIYSAKPITHAKSMKIYLTFVTLKSIEVSGAVDLKTQNKISGPEMHMTCSGASDADMEVAYDKFDMDCSGASKMTLRGTAGDVNVDFSGASKLNAYDLVVENMYLDISGAGEANVNVTKNLRAEISGAGDVRYKGNPNIDQHVSGAGSVKKVD
jgi:hypothetical protein